MQPSMQGCYARKHDELVEDMPVELAQAIIDRLANMDVFTVTLEVASHFYTRSCLRSRHMHDKGALYRILRLTD